MLSDRYVVIAGDCLDALCGMSACTIDAIVTDPPYGITFMGHKWDHGVPVKEVWCECLRVLKPGGHMLVFASTRTQHRMATAVEDAGFEIRDMIAWVYGSGWTKGRDVSKAIDGLFGAKRAVIARAKGRTGSAAQPHGSSVFSDECCQWPGDYEVTAPATDEARQWNGWHTTLKPALEPITVARKPLLSPVACNVLEYGTGALNVGATRVVLENDEAARWPANLIHDGSPEILALFPEQTSGSRGAGKRKGVGYGSSSRGDGGPAIRGSSGSAARFFYCAKATKRERNAGLSECQNKHPTVKPIDLMRYLARLVTPPDGLILDPFCGSGSTGVAAMLEGFRFVGVEKDADYCTVARERIAYSCGL